MQALRNGVKSLRSYVSTPCWVETNEAGRIGAAEGISGRVIFADFSSRKPGKIYRKNSDSPQEFINAVRTDPVSEMNQLRAVAGWLQTELRHTAKGLVVGIPFELQH